MRILAISARVPAAERAGDQIVSFFRLTYLARMGHVVEVICFGDVQRDEDRQAQQILEAEGIVVHFVLWKFWEATLNLTAAIFRTSVPFQCAIYTSARFRNKVNFTLGRFQPDVLYCVMVRVGTNIADFKGRLFVEMVDSMGLNFSRRVLLAKVPIRWILEDERRRVAAFEKALATRAERSFVVSNIDRKAINPQKVHAIPLGIYMRCCSRTRKMSHHPVLVFTGNMHYGPNADAVCWFVQKCWNTIKCSLPNARLVIAGNNPQHRVVALSRKDTSITVTGRVPSIWDVLSTATVAIAPMQSGSGMQFKVLEAMACGVPVVATTIGLGDISALPGKDLLVADSPVHFSDSVISLINSIEMNQAVGNNGLQYVACNHSWDVMNKKFVEVCGFHR